MESSVVDFCAVPPGFVLSAEKIQNSNIASERTSNTSKLCGDLFLCKKVYECDGHAIGFLSPSIQGTETEQMDQVSEKGVHVL